MTTDKTEPSLTDLREIAMRGAAKYGHQDAGLRAIYDAGKEAGRAFERSHNFPSERRAAIIQEALISCRNIDMLCPGCQGWGTKSYPSTATWRSGRGGQAFTADVCDECWGSGDAYRHGVDLRALERSQQGGPTWKDRPDVHGLWVLYRGGRWQVFNLEIVSGVGEPGDRWIGPIIIPRQGEGGTNG